jgi:DNA-binding NarL/FixJ family response regulator
MRHGRRAEPEAGHPLSELTPRERIEEVLSLIATGMSNAEIAGASVISAETVKTYVSRILAKLGPRDRVQAVVFAYQTAASPSPERATRDRPPAGDVADRALSVTSW